MNEAPLNQNAEECLRVLMRVWFDFERRLNRVPIIARLENGTFTVDDYQCLLLHLRQQVIEGSRWITRCASSFERSFADVRSIVIGHAKDEHKDYELIEQDFVSCGGSRQAILEGERNLGSEALHGYLMYRASQQNPVALVGAMWMIEGLGQKMAHGWADQVEKLTGSAGECTRFLRYHATNDSAHMEKFYHLLDRVCTREETSKAIAKTAKVVGRLYCLQLEEIDET